MDSVTTEQLFSNDLALAVSFLHGFIHCSITLSITLSQSDNDTHGFRVDALHQLHLMIRLGSVVLINAYSPSIQKHIPD